MLYNRIILQPIEDFRRKPVTTFEITNHFLPIISRRTQEGKVDQ